MINNIITYLKKEKKSLSFHEIRRKFNLTEGQLDLIVIQLLQLGYIEEECHTVGEDELKPIICRDCHQFYKCSEKNPLNIKIYKLTDKIL